MKKILSHLRKGIQDYHMIAEGDKIAIGVSGGKDSLVLLSAMVKLREFYPVAFELCAISLDMGFEGLDFDAIRDFCAELGVPYYIQQSQIKEIVFDIRKETNPCSLCAKMRKGALNEFAVNLGCNKIALGHHFDDAIETFFLCLLYEGRIGCFSPVTYLDRINITQIRPFVYLYEKEIISYVKKNSLPVQKKICPKDGVSKRQEMKEFIKGLVVNNKDLKPKILGAMQRAHVSEWGLK